MISFCHMGGSSMASYRYRCAMPAKELGASINNPDADVLIFAKPNAQDVPYAYKANNEGRKVIVDVCDMHMTEPHYKALVNLADAVTCPTQWFAAYLWDDFGIEATVIPDPYEFPEVAPHCNGDNLLWFGHALNLESLQRILPSVAGMELKIVSNIEGQIPYSTENMLRELSVADFVLMPETAPYKSANRTVEAIRQGCFVVAEPHPAINDFPIWLGNIRKGIEWAQQNRSQANSMILEAQSYVRNTYSPQTLGSAWRTLIQKVACSSTLGQERSSGPDGPPLTSTMSSLTL